MKALNTRTKVLVGLAVIGLAAWLATRNGAPEILQPSARRAATAASPAKDAPRSGYDHFRMLHTRNVFDPDRRPIHPAGPAAPPPPAKTDFVALTGTMFDTNRSLAFFSGSRTEYNKVLSVRDQIAGAAITQITPTNIEIERDGKKTLVSVGQTVPFDSATEPASAPVAAPAAAASPDAASSAPAPATAATTSGPAPAAGTANGSFPQPRFCE